MIRIDMHVTPPSPGRLFRMGPHAMDTLRGRIAEDIEAQTKTPARSGMRVTFQRNLGKGERFYADGDFASWCFPVLLELRRARIAHEECEVKHVQERDPRGGFVVTIEECEEG